MAEGEGVGDGVVVAVGDGVGVSMGLGVDVGVAGDRQLAESNKRTSAAVQDLGLIKNLTPRPGMELEG